MHALRRFIAVRPFICVLSSSSSAAAVRCTKVRRPGDGNPVFAGRPLYGRLGIALRVYRGRAGCGAALHLNDAAGARR